MVFDERISPVRQAAYEDGFAPPVASYRSFLASHKRYVKAKVYIAQPETFQDVNAVAALSALRDPRAGKQYLVRLECLDYALRSTVIKSLDVVQQALAAYRGDAGGMSQGAAKSLLRKLCRSLNANPNAVRPRFAAFAQDVMDDIEKGGVEVPDWAERLRDRLGLPHYPSTRRFGPHPVALMRYPVEYVVKGADRLGLAHAVAVPTVLDAEPYEVFHPAPRETTYGHTLNLAGDCQCEKLAAEVLHPRIDYKPGHIWKVGAITRKAGLTPGRLTELRDQHGFCLRYLSNRDDFGRM